MKRAPSVLTKIFSIKLLVRVIVGCACVAAAGIVCIKNPSHLGWISAAIVCAVLLSVAEVVSRLFDGGRAELSSSEFSPITLDYLAKTSSPLMICRESTIYWVNDAFIVSTGRKDPSGKSFTSFSGIDILKVKRFSDPEGTRIRLGASCFSVRYGSFSSKGKQYDILLWDNTTELENAKKELSANETFVAYIMADNLDEISRYSNESTRDASLALENLLTQYAEETNCIIREFRNDRYLVLVSGSDLNSMIENRFDILDRIRQIAVSGESLPVTASIGVCHTEGTLADKEKIAKEALDMALQRGGDQAVVKTAKGLEFYGGKSQTVQKRTKVRARVIANELVSAIDDASDVIIMGHKSPDFDAVGSAIGIARLCKFRGREFRIVLNTEHPNFIKCYSKVADSGEYPAEVFTPAGEALGILHSGSLCVCVDFNSREQAECPELVDMASKIVYIDHHRKTAEFSVQPVISYIEPAASSASELVSEILEQAMPFGTLQSAEALLLYSGIILDTKQFSKNTGSRTFSTAVFLRNEGANPADAQPLFASSLDEVVMQARLESSATVYKDIFAITRYNGVRDRVIAAKAADSLLLADGIYASFALCEVPEGTHISCRSNGLINVQLIAEALGGGGHFDSAATIIQDDVVSSEKMLKKAIDEYITSALNEKTTPKRS